MIGSSSQPEDGEEMESDVESVDEYKNRSSSVSSGRSIASPSDEGAMGSDIESVDGDGVRSVSSERTITSPSLIDSSPSSDTEDSEKDDSDNPSISLIPSKNSLVSNSISIFYSTLETTFFYQLVKNGKIFFSPPTLL